MRILVMGDIHIGSIPDCPYVYNVLRDIIDKEVMIQHTDVVVITGDYFDRLFKVNDSHVALAINVMSYLVRACKKHGTKIRIIYGTESHEVGQYSLFNYHLSSNRIDMKLITTCTEEELAPDYHVLYVPEEYLSDKHEFYKSTLYSGKHYNVIFGHGIIEDGMPPAVTYTKSANGEKQVPRFKSEELAAAADLTVFNHYHVHTTMPGNVHYIGSLFRDSFGEEEPKGYGIINGTTLEFVENTEAYIYKTYEFDETSDVYKSTDNLVAKINEIKEENKSLFDGTKTGKIRLIFHTTNDDAAFQEALKSILVGDKVIHPLIKESGTQTITTEDDEVLHEYEFVLDSSLPIDEKIYRFIRKQYDDEIPLEDLIHYIRDPLDLS